MRDNDSNDNSPPGGMLGTISFDHLVSFYEREIILLLRLLRAEQEKRVHFEKLLEARHEERAQKIDGSQETA